MSVHLFQVLYAFLKNIRARSGWPEKQLTREDINDPLKVFLYFEEEQVSAEKREALMLRFLLESEHQRLKIKREGR